MNKMLFSNCAQRSMNLSGVSTVMKYCARPCLIQQLLPSACSRLYTSTSKMLQHRTLGLVREDPAREWERRTVLTPKHVQELVHKHNVRVIVQPSDKRCFRDSQYADAGATISNDLSPATVILGVKEVPIKDIMQGDRLYLSFWHCWKGQMYNMPRLRKQLSSGATFCDWELLTDDNGTRTTAFGYMAGFSGMMDGIASTLSMKCLSVGYNTPFVYLPRPIQCRTFEDCKNALALMSEHVAKDGTPKGLGPVIFAVIGTGRVASGAVDVLKAAGVEWVKPAELKSLSNSPKTSLKKLYAVQLSASDYLTAKDGSVFDREKYRAHPEQYRSVFAEEIAPYVTCVLNGAFYRDGIPKVMTTFEYIDLKAKLAEEKKENSRFLAVIDVSADWEGGMEFVKRPSDINDPTFYLNDKAEEDPKSRNKNSTALMTIEILPAELPLPSSEHFSACAYPYIEALFAQPRTSAQEKALVALRRSTIVKNGHLVEPHSWLTSLLDSPAKSLDILADDKMANASSADKNVLLLGSGLVAGPACDVFLHRKDVKLTIASAMTESAQAMVGGRAAVVHLDVADTAHLENLIQANTVVLSLLPAPLHTEVAKLCIKHGVHLVTASYESEAMKALHEDAVKAGVTIMNEIGLDPGIDHLLAAQMIHDARSQGKEITSFVSWCGGLPDEEICKDLHLKYKFSWSPRGVLAAATNSASFVISNVKKHITGEDLLVQSVPVNTIEGFKLEGLANRNSFDYLPVYGLDPSLRTMFRGTLRWPGTCKTLQSMKECGLFSTQEFSAEQQPKTWSEVLERSQELQTVRSKQVVPQKNGIFEWLGLSGISKKDDESPSFPTNARSPIDYLTSLLTSKLSYLPGERDLVLLQHEISLRSISNPSEVETWTSKLVLYGDPSGHSAMAKTVGIPAALATLLLLDQEMERGVIRPIAKEVWEVLLPQLKDQGIVIEETKRSGGTVLPGF